MTSRERRGGRRGDRRGVRQPGAVTRGDRRQMPAAPRGGRALGGRSLGGRARGGRPLGPQHPVLTALRTGRLALIATLAGAALLLTAPIPRVAAQSYSLYGDIETALLYDYLADGVPEHTVSGLTSVVGNHRLSFDMLEFTATHRFTWIAGGYAGAAAAAAQSAAQAGDDGAVAGDGTSVTVVNGEAPAATAGGAVGAGTQGTGTPIFLHEVDTASAELFLGTRASLRAGKHRLSWGTARTLTPSDSVHPDGALPAATEGFLGLSGSFTAGPSAVLEAGVAVDDALDLSAAGGAQGSDRAFRRDLRYAGRGSFFLFNTLEVAPSMVFQDDATARPGLGLSANLGSVLLFAEGAAELLNPYRYPEISGDGTAGAPPSERLTAAEEWEPAWLASAGAEWSRAFGPVQVTLTGEYFYNGVGYSNAEREQLYDMVKAAWQDQPGSIPPPAGMMALLGGAAAPSPDRAAHPLGLPPFLGLHYALPQLTIDVAGYVSATTLGIASVGDGSALVTQRITITPTSSFDVTLLGSVALGEEYESEFGTFPGTTTLPGRISAGIGAAIHF